MKIIIIGAGPGGYETAIEAARRGVEVILVEKGEVGGTCLNEGCIPTKTLCRSAEILEEMRSASEFGVCPPGEGASEVHLDFAQVQNRKTAVVEQLRSGVETLLANKLITLVRGTAVIKDAHTVTVSSSDYQADYIIVATGSVPSELNVPGADLPSLMTSSDLLQIESVPESMCVIGAGVIGLEFASIFAAFGTRVTVVEYCRQILPRFDGDLAKRLKQSLSKRGIEIVTSAAVKSIETLPGSEGSLHRVLYECKGKEQEVISAKVLLAVGRRPLTGGLGLERADVAYSPKGIEVDGNMRTSCPSIYAIGDVTGKMMLAHAATYQGLRALNHIMGRVDSINIDLVPSAVFTMPEAASVGLTEEDCVSRGIAFKALKSFFRPNGKAVAMGQTDGFVKLIVAEPECKDHAPGEILGCHLFGPHAADLVHEAGALMAMHASAEDLSGIIHAHPTLSEVFRLG